MRVVAGKFSMLYDKKSDKYWALTNMPGGDPRHTLTLHSSTNLKSWTFEREVLRGPSSKFHGFNYPDMHIDGDDIVFVSRTAWEDASGQPPRWHDGNMFTFHRIPAFRGDDLGSHKVGSGLKDTCSAAFSWTKDKLKSKINRDEL